MRNLDHHAQEHVDFILWTLENTEVFTQNNELMRFEISKTFLCSRDDGLASKDSEDMDTGSLEKSRQVWLIATLPSFEKNLQ